jgi:hypothetical protein
MLRGARRYLLTCLLLTACAAPGGSRPPAATPAPVAAAAPVAATVAAARAPAERDPVICKNVTPVGTRFVRRACMRESAWLQAQRDGREAAERVQRTATQIGNNGGG